MKEEGFIRILFAQFSHPYVLFQVNAHLFSDIWNDQQNYNKLRYMLEQLESTEVHILSKHFYVIGPADSVLSRDSEKICLEIKG